MTTFDSVSNIIGPPLHSWLFHSATPATEDDIGSDPDSDFATGSGTYTAQVAGPLQDGTTSYGVEFVDGYLDRSAGLSSNDWGSVTTGSISWWFTSESATTQVMWGSNPTGKAFQAFIESDGTVGFQVINDSVGTKILTDNAVNYADGEWHFAVVVCDGSTANKIYMDGSEVAVAETTTLGGLGSWPWIGNIDDDSTSNFRAGNNTRAPTEFDFPLVGAISRLAFWGQVLSSSEVEELWQAAFGIASLPIGTSKTYLDLDLPMTNSAYMAQRLAWRRLRQTQRPITLALPVNLRAMRHAVGDVLTVTVDDLDIVADTFRVSGWRLGDDGTKIEMTLRQDDAQAYADPSPAQYTTPAALPTLTAGTVQVPPPTALAAAAALEGIQLSWTAPDNLLGVHHYAIYSDTDSSWAGASLIGTTLSTNFLHALSSTVTRYYWVRAVDAAGYESIRSPDSDTSTVSATYTAGTIATPGAAQTLGGIDGTPSTGQLTGSFTRAGVTVASKVFTATHSGGNLTVTAAADTGEATTYTLSGDGTPTVVVTQRHTGSNTTNGTMTFTVAP